MGEKYYVSVTCAAINTSARNYHASLDNIAAELFKLEGGQGAKFSTDAPNMRITFGFVIEAITLEQAGAKASSLARTALHAAGQATPGWKGLFDIVESTQKQLQTA